MRRHACVVAAVVCVLAMANGAAARVTSEFDLPNAAVATNPQTIVSAQPSDGAATNQSFGLQVKQRLQESLTGDLLDHFDLFVYVSKAKAGPWAQRMYVFQKQPDRDLYQLYDWPISTGREEIEPTPLGQPVPTSTPAGYYELDPGRFYAQYRSEQWGEPMAYAMFLKWIDHGVKTGLAIHAAPDDALDQLGARASAGCVRLAPENARILFTLIHDSYKGDVPALAYDKTTQTVMNNGMLERDESGNLKFEPGFRVLVLIDEYGGRNLEAALY